jgi:cytochrome c-type biogenesis protein CcmE
MRRRWAAIAAVVLVLTFAWLLGGGLNRDVVYFLTPTELLAKGTAVLDAPVRIGGQVKPGSVQWDADVRDLRFVVTDGSNEIAVRSTGAPPQMFRDGIGVIVEGRYGSDGLMRSSTLMVKHSNEYYPPAEGEKPKDVYQTLIKDPRQ